MGAVRVNPAPAVEEVPIGTITVNANSTTYTSKAIPAKSGYKVGGVVGISWSHPATIIMSACWKQGSDVYIIAHSYYGANLTEAVTMDVLYLPN